MYKADNNINFGRNLQMLRKCSRLTQDDIGYILKSKRNTIADYERGIRIPNASKLSILANLFKISIDELLNSTLVNNEIPLDQIMKESVMKFKKSSQKTDDYISLFMMIRTCVSPAKGLDWETIEKILDK